MNKLKNIMGLAICSVIGVVPALAQISDSSAYNSSTAVTTTTTAANQSNDMTMYMIAGVVFLIILAFAIYFMVRNRRTTISGIQSQDRPQATPGTTDAINNPASGI